MKSGSNLLDSKKNESWRDLPQSEQRNSATQLMNAVEESAELVASGIHTAPQAPVINIEVNIGKNHRLMSDKEIMKVYYINEDGISNTTLFNAIHWF